MLRWLDTVVIGVELCPFAAAVRRHTRVVVCQADDGLSMLLAEAAELAAASAEQPATTLVVLPGLASDFDAFMALRERLLRTLPPSLQAVPFHPRAVFDDGGGGPADPNDAAQFVARSPLPVLHLLRVGDVARAEAGWEGPEIGEANAARLRGLGAGVLASMLARCGDGLGDDARA